MKARGAKKILVDESVYSFKKSQKRSGSISITNKLAPINDNKIMKAMLASVGKPVLYSTNPTLTLNE